MGRLLEPEIVTIEPQLDGAVHSVLHYAVYYCKIIQRQVAAHSGQVHFCFRTTE